MNTSEATRMQAAQQNVHRHFAEGDFIFSEGEVGHVAYVVEKGQVEICKLSDGQLIVLKVLQPGDMFGEMALIDKSPRSASARALRDVQVREIDEAALMVHIRKAPEVAIDMMHRLADYVRSSNKSLELSGHHPPMIEPGADNLYDERNRWQLWQSDQEAILDEFGCPAEALDKKLMPRVALVALFTIFTLVAAFFIWASISVIDTTVTARGRLVTTVPTIDVQSTGSAAIKQVNVVIGSHVKQGDVLLVLDETFAEADLSRVTKEIAQLDDEIFRLQAEIADRPLSEAEQINDLVQRSIFLNRRNEYRSKISSFEQDMKNLEWRLTSARKDAEMAQSQLGIKQRLEDVREKLFERQIGSEVDYLLASNDRLKSEREYSELTNSINGIIGQMNALKAEQQAFVSGRYSSIGEQLAAALKRRSGLAEERAKLEKRKQNIEVTAPTDGIIIAMENIYTGGVVQEGGVIMTLVPSNVPLSAEVDIDPQDISSLYVGAMLSVKLDAMPYQKHGDLQAEITFISEDTVTESLTGDKGTFYRVHADIQQNNMYDLPTDFRLVPGMLFSGDIKVGQRRLITYFLYPVIRTLETSFTEPS